MYDRILFPTDGSEGTESALDHALDHARKYGATLHVLYVIEETYPVVEAGPADVLNALRAEGERVLDEVGSRARNAGVESVQTTLIGGSPYRQILQYVDEHDVDLIVMGTHGRRGMDRYLLGSVAEKVVRTADCPVLTVRADER
jgi:nucleotide-binding universal stress UspA family protein